VLTPEEAAEVWDGQTYCPDCVEAAGLAACRSRMPRLEESIHFRFWPALARGLWSGFYLTTLLALAILVFFLFINAAFLLQQWLVGPGNPAQRLFALPRTAAFFSVLPGSLSAW
jgi:hypothetical protein